MRDRTGTFLIEGERESVRAAAHLEVEVVIVREDRVDAGFGSPVVVSEAAFSKLSARENPDGVALVARTPDHSLAGFTLPASGVVLIGDGIEKPGNIGAMIRTADALGAAFIGSELATDLVNPNTVRSAQGSLFSTPIAAADRIDAIRWTTEHTRVVVAEPTADTELWDTDLAGPVSIVIGSEHAGVDASWVGVGEPASLPMHGAADSLNASVAAALFVAEAIRQRR